MSNQEHYDALAERLLFGDLSGSDLTEFARYNPGKSIEDLDRVMKQDFGPPFTTESQIAQVSRRLALVMEIDATESLRDFGARLDNHSLDK